MLRAPIDFDHFFSQGNLFYSSFIVDLLMLAFTRTTGLTDLKCGVLIFEDHADLDLMLEHYQESGLLESTQLMCYTHMWTMIWVYQ